MPKPTVSAKVTTRQTVEVRLKPSLRTELRPLVKTILDNQAEMRRLKKETKAKLEEVSAAFKASKATKELINGVEVDGVPLKMICGTQKKLNKDMLIELGCEVDWLEEATEEIPKKPYIKVGTGKEEEE